MGQFEIDRGSVKQPENVSPVYCELQAFVEKNFSDRTQALRDLIFCVAYTEYARSKKNYVINHLRDGTADPGTAAISKAHLQHQGDKNFAKYCKTAENFIAGIQGKASEAALASISSVIVDEIGKKNAALVKEVHSTVHEQSWIAFFKEILRHSLVIICSAALILLIAWLLALIAPFLLSAGAKYLQPIIDAVQGNPPA